MPVGARSWEPKGDAASVASLNFITSSRTPRVARRPRTTFSCAAGRTTSTRQSSTSAAGCHCWRAKCAESTHSVRTELPQTLVETRTVRVDHLRDYEENEAGARRLAAGHRRSAWADRSQERVYESSARTNSDSVEHTSARQTTGLGRRRGGRGRRVERRGRRGMGGCEDRRLRRLLVRSRTRFCDWRGHRDGRWWRDGRSRGKPRWHCDS